MSVPVWKRVWKWIVDAQESVPNDVLLARSYRFLRLATAIMGLAIVISMVLERSTNADGWEESISAYYYTAARPIFTGALVAIGGFLLAIKGRTTWEDIFLNLAGMMAPLVPLIPPNQASLETGSVLSDVGFAISDPQRHELLVNSLTTIAVVAAVGLVAAWITASGKNAEIGLRRADKAGLAIAAFVIGFGSLLYVLVDFVRENAHGIAAIIMFVFVWGAAMITRISTPLPKYRKHYTYVAIWMPAAAAAVGLGKLVHGEWRHTVLVLELLELLPFMYYWFTQTAEHWKVGLVTDDNRAAA